MYCAGGSFPFTIKASKGGNGPDINEVFSTYNKASDGELTQSELQSSIEGEGAKMQAKGGGGAPPPMPGGKSATKVDLLA